MAVTMPAAAQPDPQPRVIVEGLAFPTGIAFTSDGARMFVNERPGRMLVVDERRRDVREVARVETTTAGETGLLDLAVSPNDRFVYAFVTDPSGTSNRVVRVPIDGGDVEVVVDDLPASVYHNGGGVAFDADGMLLVSNGENHNESRAQDPDERGGKVYRFTPEGAPAPGNPFGESIALGLRNPFGLTVDPVTGDAFVTENGVSSHDEINRVVVGGNYGWPEIEGSSDGARPSGPGDYVDPLLDYPEVIVPTGIAIADPANAPDDVAGDVFFGGYLDGAVHRLELNDDRSQAVSDNVIAREDSGIVAVAWGPHGLYYSTTDAVKLIPLASASSNDAAETARAPLVGPPLRPPENANANLYLLLGGAALIVVIGAGWIVVRRRR
ncbi:MAG: PQQ-dependent sugar dehydrogenase [Actinomycetota bacterium]